MTQQQKDELNKELCGLLGIEWHELRMIWQCTCGICFDDDVNELREHIKRCNSDFTSEAGRVQLLKLMFERKGFDKFIDLMVNPYNFILYLRDDNGAFARAARDFLKAMEGK